MLVTGHGQTGTNTLNGDYVDPANDYNWRGEIKNKLALTGYTGGAELADSQASLKLARAQSIVWDYEVTGTPDPNNSGQQFIFDANTKTEISTLDSTNVNWWHAIEGFQSLQFVSARDIIDSYDNSTMTEIARTLSGRKRDPSFEWGALRALGPYLWPKENTESKLRVLLALSFLV